ARAELGVGRARPVALRASTGRRRRRARRTAIGAAVARRRPSGDARDRARASRVRARAAAQGITNPGARGRAAHRCASRARDPAASPARTRAARRVPRHFLLRGIARMNATVAVARWSRLTAQLAVLTPLALLLFRLFVAIAFWRAGVVKWADPTGTAYLFENEYHVPLLAPAVAAALACGPNWCCRGSSRWAWAPA